MYLRPNYIGSYQILASPTRPSEHPPQTQRERTPLHFTRNHTETTTTILPTFPPTRARQCHRSQVRAQTFTYPAQRRHSLRRSPNFTIQPCLSAFSLTSRRRVSTTGRLILRSKRHSSHCNHVAAGDTLIRSLLRCIRAAPSLDAVDPGYKRNPARFLQRCRFWRLGLLRTCQLQLNRDRI